MKRRDFTKKIKRPILGKPKQAEKMGNKPTPWKVGFTHALASLLVPFSPAWERAEN